MRVFVGITSVAAIAAIALLASGRPAVAQSAPAVACMPVQITDLSTVTASVAIEGAMLQLHGRGYTDLSVVQALPAPGWVVCGTR